MELVCSDCGNFTQEKNIVNYKKFELKFETTSKLQMAWLAAFVAKMLLCNKKSTPKSKFGHNKPNNCEAINALAMTMINGFRFVFV